MAIGGAGILLCVEAAASRARARHEYVQTNSNFSHILKHYNGGAISADPLSERPELRFVELPRGSVLPDLEGVVFMRKLARYRRMGESEGKLRYIEVSKEKPYVVSSFSLDDGGSSWTLDHEVAFTTVWDDEPLKEMPAIGAIDPLNSHVVYLVCGNQLLGVDMEKEKITGSSRLAIPSVPILPSI
ncbi:hypothetical protein TRIUR3_07207 [Triticum urartu]|uniref:Uncharacterized protein n=1 Tax=Triticum urartu TaxID=4572 RepID=M7YIB1_TRIUA|nr:hypothetical protein TRIUR3_07207 [Triticum urartu]